MKSIFSFLIFFVAFIFQTTIFSQLEFFGVSPNIILCLIVVMGFLYDNLDTFLWAIIFGLLQDIYFSQVIGISAFCCFLLALGIYVVKDFVNRENAISALGMVIGATVIYQGIYWFMGRIFGSIYGITPLLQTIVPLILYHIVIVIILYNIFIRKVVKHRNDSKFKGKFRIYQ